MAKTNAERQAAFRKARKDAGGKRVDMILTGPATFWLEKIAQWEGVPESTVIARLLGAEDARLSAADASYGTFHPRVGLVEEGTSPGRGSAATPPIPLTPVANLTS